MENCEIESFQESLINKMIKGINKEIENYFIEGLKRKGYKFDDKIELEHFIKTRCRCEDNTGLKQKTYFVNEIPFFLHDYNIDINFKTIIEDRKTTMTANNGYYAFL